MSEGIEAEPSEMDRKFSASGIDGDGGGKAGAAHGQRASRFRDHRRKGDIYEAIISD